jgi:hypothetical protein
VEGEVNMLRGNMIAALRLAIEVRAEQEREWGYTGESALLAGWRQVLSALKRGERVEVSV